MNINIGLKSVAAKAATVFHTTGIEWESHYNGMIIPAQIQLHL